MICSRRKISILEQLKPQIMKKIYFIFFSILCYSGQLAAQCTTPVVSNATGPAAICSGETATLTAEADSGVLNWFDSETGDVQLGTGSPFETAALTETTSFWVEAN